VKDKIFNISPIPALLLAMISVNSGAAIAKTLFPLLGATATASLRIGLSAIILLTVYRPNLFKISNAQWRIIIPYGLTLGAMNLAFYLALERISIGLAVTIEFIGPLVLAILGSKRLLDYLWVVLAASGIILIAPWSDNNVDFTGVLFALVAASLWATYIVFGGKVSKIFNGGEAVAIGMLFASLLIVPFGILENGFSKLTMPLFYSGIGLALLSSAIPFTLEMKALAHLPSRTFSILMSLEPATAALCGLLFLNERLSPYEIIAVICVITASIGATVFSKSTT
jgi:inner membrane transporter RhtA